jgi:hypothetical protein
VCEPHCLRRCPPRCCTDQGAARLARRRVSRVSRCRERVSHCRERASERAALTAGWRRCSPTLAPLRHSSRRTHACARRGACTAAAGMGRGAALRMAAFAAPTRCPPPPHAVRCPACLLTPLLTPVLRHRRQRRLRQRGCRTAPVAPSTTSAWPWSRSAA